ncbi:peroxisomal membrane protein 11A [Aplysia californica]|uniref:Peroxisomal membrane protein 11A n=1 Tax=Aplysia californica TaxID=6500 RepID=A0ABM0K3D0_APLCA|nr:peroxisomal membrane protein 11A [Aplysia californica]
MSLSKDIVKFNAHTSARDKIFRFVQYGSRLLLWQLTYGSPDVQGEVVARLRKLESALSLSRKLFRLGNSVDLAHKALDSLSIPETALMVLAVTSHSFKAIWLLMDHLLWLAKVGLVKVDNAFWTQWSLRAWLVALAAASASDVIKFERVHNQLDKHRKENGADAKIPRQLQLDMHAVRMNFWRDFCDLFIPLGGLRYVSPGVAAVCGVVSSVIGFTQEWEKHVRPFQPDV